MGIFADEKEKIINIEGVEITLKPLAFGDVAMINSKIKDYAIIGKDGLPEITDEGMALYQQLLILYSIKKWSLKDKINLKNVSRLKPYVAQKILEAIGEFSGVDIKNSQNGQGLHGEDTL